MLKKTIKHNDIEGLPTETDAYFNLTKAEAIELNIRNDLELIGRGRDNNEIMDAFKRILQMAYGIRTGDGRFIKVNAQGTPLFHEFATTEAYSELFMELWQDPDYAREFILGILPAELSDRVDSQTDLPAHLANHPSMQGHKAAQPSSRREARQSAPEPTPVETETPDQMRFRIRQELLAEMQSEKNSQTQAAEVSQTPPEAGQPVYGYPSRDQLN